MIHFTSDQHFDHAKVIEYAKRPFSSVGEMNECIIARHNEKVKPDDMVFHLGDFAFSSSPARIEELVSRLNGKKTFIFGNHDNYQLFPLPGKGSRKVEDYLIHWWYSNETVKEFKLNDDAGNTHRLVMSHYPMLSWNKSFHGSYHLHGHSHGYIPFDPKVRRLDVGVDPSNFYPLSLDEVHEKLKVVPTPKELAAAKE